MTSIISKFVFKRILKETVSNNFGKSDPTFESIPTKKLSHDAARKFTSNKKKLRKALPPGLSERDQDVLVKVKRRAYRLDMSLFSLFGIRFGWGSIIGLVPAIGDVLDCLLALMVVRAASECELPPNVKTKMVFNIVLDFVVGLVPFLGDLADAVYKANTRNAIILEDYLRERGKESLKKQGVAHPPPDYSLPEEFENQPEMDSVHGAGPSSARRAREPDLEAQRPGKSGNSKGSGKSCGHTTRQKTGTTHAPSKSKSKSKSSRR